LILDLALTFATFASFARNNMLLKLNIPFFIVPFMGTNSDLPDPSADDLDFITDPGAAPHKRTAEQGIADMHRHLELLRSDLAKWKELGYPKLVAQIEADIRDTEARLAEYQTQQSEGRN
jgi:hypothetical protein